MTEPKLLAALAVATVGLALILAGGVAAKARHCRKDCKQDPRRTPGTPFPQEVCDA